MDESIAKMKGPEYSSDVRDDKESCRFVEDGGGDFYVGEDGMGTMNESSEGSECDDIDQIYNVDTMEDIFAIDLKALSPHNTRKVDFASLEVAYQFYNWYAGVNGFAARKAKIERSSKDQILQRTFVCHRQGFRADIGLTIENRRREPKPETRCGCETKFRVHIDIYSQRWVVTCFTDRHNHELLSEKYSGMLAAHRRMTESDIMQMNNVLKVGINPPHIYGYFASQSGGYEKIGFSRKDMYNQIGKQRRSQ